MKRPVITITLVAATTLALLAQERAPEQVRRAGAAERLQPTLHPPLPGHASLYWFVPELTAAGTPTARRAEDAVSRFARGAQLIAGGEFAQGLPLINVQQLTGSALEPYAQYYRAVALEGLSRLDQADAALTALVASKPEGYLKEGAALRLGAVAIARDEPGRAEDLLERLSRDKVSSPEQVFVALGRAEEAVGHADHALQAYSRVYYDFPLSTEANEAQAGMERLQTPALVPADRYARELTRAEQLFAARRWAQARAAFEPLARAAQGDDDREADRESHEKADECATRDEEVIQSEPRRDRAIDETGENSARRSLQQHPTDRE